MSQVAPRVHDFTFTIAGVEELTVAVADALFAAGCDDASPHSEGPTVYLDFHREAESLGKAICSAVNDVERAGFAVARSMWIRYRVEAIVPQPPPLPRPAPRRRGVSPSRPGGLGHPVANGRSRFFLSGCYAMAV